MQQNDHQITNNQQDYFYHMLSSPLQEADAYLTSLCQYFSKDSEVYKTALNSLNILKNIASLLKIKDENRLKLEKLNEEFFICIQNINACLTAQQNEQFVDLKNAFQAMAKRLQNEIAFDADPTATSTGTQYLHSMGFNRIVNMINTASTYEPEWMSRTGTLLILDNNPNTSQALMRRLTRDGHIVLNATNEEEAFNCLHAHKIEAILLDYQTFKDKLLDFLSHLEKDSSIGYLPLIIIGAPENVENLQKITEAGIGDYLAKPVNPALLKMRVHAVLEKKYAFEERLKRTRELQRTRQELEAAIQDLPDGFAIFDQNNQMVMHNDKLFEFYPHLKNRSEMIRGGLTFENFLKANLAADIYVFEEKNETSHRLWIEEKEANFLLPASQWEESLINGLTLGITTYRTPDGGGALVAKDISKDKAHHQDLTFLAYHDSLTGLPNKKAFHQKLTQSISDSQITTNQFLAVLFLDLDGFKNVNDTYGHDMGDWLLNQVGQRLRHCIRGNDVLARFGGDEFCIILNHTINRHEVEIVALRILKSISKPYIRHDIAMNIGVSIGISIHSKKLESSDVLLKEADMAMYVAKQAGKGQFYFYDDIYSQKINETKPS